MAESIPITANEIANDLPDANRNERFHLAPKERLLALVSTSALVGGLAGFYDGVRASSLRYLTENAHRLPKTVGGWYFYHKKKNYVMVVSGVKQAVRTGFKYGGAVGGFFGLEYLLDTARGNTIDFLNTTTAAFITATVYSTYNQLSYIQTRKMIFKGTTLGLILGLAQDYLIHAREGRVWYFDRYIHGKQLL
ncbi:hypothetical protein Cantr_07848 [Candida viswanathii]|uniref:Mitochondrial import inner membrane translocase subunit TIM23 n=1 Tax=Candida viswanathii TaxID=5486 RepID=A0A367Y1V3_9ASCO|nr:hypothetical protein Cantr_07848 [Candida viswanathii]